MKTFRLLLAGCTIAVVLSSRAAAQTQPASRPADAATSKPAKSPIKVAYDTTHFTGPLRPDGTVDYVAAINEKYSKGVTKENNAAVVFVQVFDPTALGERFRGVVFTQWEIPAKRPGPFLKTYYYAGHGDADMKEYESAQAAPWKIKDHPELAKWLADNRSPLDKFVLGAERPRYYLPWVGQENNGIIVEYVTPLSQCLYAAKMLIIRANLAIGEGRTDDARKDIRCAYRISWLLEQSPLLLDRMLAVSASALADIEIQHIVPALDAKAAKAFIADIEALPPVPSIITAMDGWERCKELTLLTTAATNPQKLKDYIDDMRLMFAAGGPLRPQEEKEFTKWLLTIELAPQVDWNAAMRGVNQNYDRLLDVLKTPQPELKRKRVAELTDERAKIEAWANILPRASASRKDKTQWVIDNAQSSGPTISAFVRADQMADRCAAIRGLSLLTLALRVHKIEKGSYPAKLWQLSPAYLKALPVDPFSGKEFIYKLQDKGYLLYSVGDDGIDDGGTNTAKRNLVVRVKE